MTDKLSWRTLMETRTEKRKKLQTPTLVAIIIGLHVTAVGSVVFIQGCGSNKPLASEPPPVIVMPPKTEAYPSSTHGDVTAPVFKPPVAVEPAPRTLPDAEAQVYEVRSGDSLSVIARRAGVSTAAIMDLNKIKDANKIRVGQKLLLPPDAKVSAPPAKPTAAAPAPRTAAPSVSASVEGGSTYVIQAGDSLSSIARRHGVTSARLAEVNKIADPNRIRVGQKLTIPDGKTPAPSTETAPAPVPTPSPASPLVAPEPVAPAQAQFSGASESFPYTVLPGDTLDSIAGDFTVLRSELIMLNNLTGSETLRPGQTLLIPPFTQP